MSSTVEMTEYRDVDDRSRWLVGHGWAISRETGKARVLRSASDTTGLSYLGRRIEIPYEEIEGCEMGLNAAEREVYVRLRLKGKTVLRAGWPDLLVLDGDEVYAVEVKRPADKVSARQQEMHEALGKAGIRVEVEVVR